MKKIVLSLAMMLSLTACPTTTVVNPSTGASGTPNSSTGGAVTVGANGSFASKQDFVTFLNCLKSKPEVDAQAKSAIDLQIQAVAFIPDAQWAMIGAQYGSFAQTYLSIAKSSGCAN